jgi:tRNA(Leu) C34 or U34 (ribose-2'-O)-methylase TrmL
MNKYQVIEIINEYRKDFKPQIEEKKGMRFRDDDRVLRRLRMDYFHEENLAQLPSIDEFLRVVTEQFLRDNVQNSIREQASLDYNYENPEKWI